MRKPESNYRKYTFLICLYIKVIPVSLPVRQADFAVFAASEQPLLYHFRNNLFGFIIAERQPGLVKAGVDIYRLFLSALYHTQMLKQSLFYNKPARRALGYGNTDLFAKCLDNICLNTRFRLSPKTDNAVIFRYRFPYFIQALFQSVRSRTCLLYTSRCV